MVELERVDKHKKKIIGLYWGKDGTRIAADQEEVPVKMGSLILDNVNLGLQNRHIALLEVL